MDSLLAKNLKPYLAYNQFRITRLLELMPPKSKPLFHVLTFLLHTNLKGLPGYIKDPETPYGIEKYTFPPDLESSFATLFPSYPLRARMSEQSTQNKLCIKSLLLMGSVGSVAQTAKSDFDYWACFNENSLNPKQLKLLKEKLFAIEKWADEEHDLEVHFFPTDIKRAQVNNFGEADKESAGSAIARLLKEEFYRTCVLVAGRIPFWCLTPTGISNDKYDKHKEAAKQSSEVNTGMLVDLGNLHEISTGEFFGAALWQMNKAMDSPYKSVLKMAMLEGFLDPDVESQLLCNIVKNRIHERAPKKDDWKRYDPYATMFDHILDYYIKKERNDVVELLQTCFYIKIGFKARKSQIGKDDLNFKQRTMLDYIENWGWDQNKLDDLNDFKEWDFEKVLSLGNRVHNFLIQTYRNLADRLNKEDKANQMISDQDITVLGRKLFTFYSQKKGKVQLMKKAFDEGLWQESVTFSADFNKQRKVLWSFYSGKHNKQFLSTWKAKEKLLRQGLNIVNIVISAIHNQMIDKKTSLYFVLPNPSPVGLADIQKLMHTTLEHFPSSKISSISNKALLDQEKKARMLIVLNFDSPRWMQEINTVSIVYLNSWGELFCETYLGKEGVEKVIEYLLEDPSNEPESLRKNFEIFVPHSEFSKKIYEALRSKLIKKIGKL